MFNEIFLEEFDEQLTNIQTPAALYWNNENAAMNTDWN